MATKYTLVFYPYAKQIAPFVHYFVYPHDDNKTEQQQTIGDCECQPKFSFKWDGQAYRELLLK